MKRKNTQRSGIKRLFYPHLILQGLVVFVQAFIKRLSVSMNTITEYKTSSWIVATRTCRLQSDKVL